MKKTHLLYGLFAILFLVFTGLTVIDRNKIKVQAARINELGDQIQTLNRSIAGLEEEKEELENNISASRNSEIRSLYTNIASPTTNQEFSRPNVSAISIPTANGIAIVVYKPSSCDYFILENASGYIVAEWFGGNDPDLGDKITGDFGSYGMKDYYNQTKDLNSRLWLDDYMLSKDDALEKIKDQCN